MAFYTLNRINGIMVTFNFGSKDEKNKLFGDLGETFYKNYSDQKGFAYCRADDIGWEFIHKRVIRLKKGFHRIDVRVPEELRRLLMDIIGPNPDYPKTPAYSFDFISCVIGDGEIKKLKADEILEGKEPGTFTIVEVKTGSSTLTRREEEVKKKCKERDVRYRVFRITEMDKPVRKWDFSME